MWWTGPGAPQWYIRYSRNGRALRAHRRKPGLHLECSVQIDYLTTTSPAGSNSESGLAAVVVTSVAEEPTQPCATTDWPIGCSGDGCVTHTVRFHVLMNHRGFNRIVGPYPLRVAVEFVSTNCPCSECNATKSSADNRRKTSRCAAHA